ncbi:polysaccharide deacetylase domain-containing protein [Hamiltosporidium tvaerminnensis]|uniref:Polysaccharide deacetylase domain-containing protein n=2 Tax=Hamiltosporidium TaxID=1176354 RepID=A0A4Q9LEE6_9MICR|nr:hypothetical protein LUQ84_000726 [Hamiltosporidium tvaerminnensis]TBU04968.1 polysaccharide deacetylase domain-containing protein [Hamiltosporidium tvaerminnensis]TBU06328.1 polysaccharide deacetylase domain-containing protein [Hamiltosporidium magnivora]
MFFLGIISYIFAASLPDKCVDSGVICITFDDGPTGYTGEVLDMLEENNIKATFHFTVQNITRGNISGMMRRAIDEGHCVGIRLNPKRDYDQMEADDIKSDIDNQVKVMEGELDRKIKFARAPVNDGEVNADVYNALLEKGITQTNYSYCFYYEADDSEDATRQLKMVLNASNPKYESFIFLLHDEKERDFPMLEDIIKYGKEKGYSFVTMDECLKGYDPKDMEKGRKGSRLSDSSGVDKLLMVPLCLLIFLLI